MTPTFRHADKCDMANVSRFYDDIWRETYLSLMDDRELKSWRARRDWRTLPAGNGSIVIAEYEGRLIGFGACGPARDGELGTFGEIYAVHVARPFRSRGIGSALMGRMARELAERDVADVGLWVFHRNVAAVVFARSLGAIVAGSRGDTRGVGHSELALVWAKAGDLALFDDGQHRLAQPASGHRLGMMPFTPCIPACK